MTLHDSRLAIAIIEKGEQFCINIALLKAGQAHFGHTPIVLSTGQSTNTYLRAISRQVLLTETLSWSI
jgi:hypothetical protein